MATKALEKAEKVENDTLAALEVRSAQVHDSLQGDRTLLTERVVKGHIKKMEEAVTEYEDSITSIFVAVGDEDEKKRLYSDRLIKQMAKVNPLLDQLYQIQTANKAASNPEVTSESCNSVKSKACPKVYLNSPNPSPRC